jgi:hypothetical protein
MLTAIDVTRAAAGFSGRAVVSTAAPRPTLVLSLTIGSLPLPAAEFIGRVM